jgi:RNA polymerase sigma factor (sigma-70 family)
LRLVPHPEIVYVFLAPLSSKPRFSKSAEGMPAHPRFIDSHRFQAHGKPAGFKVVVEWDKEVVLKQVYVAARRFVARYIGGVDSEDIASEVVVYLLSHPKELERLRTLDQDALIAASRHFAWRRLAPVLRRQERASVFVPTIEDDDDDESGVSYDLPDHYSFDSKKTRGLPQMKESPSFEYAADDLDFQTLMSTRESSEELDSVPDAQLESGNLIELLGKFLSQDALKLLIGRYIEEKSVKEIAATLGTSEVEVARQLNMARELARKALQPV